MSLKNDQNTHINGVHHYLMYNTVNPLISLKVKNPGEFFTDEAVLALGLRHRACPPRE